MITEDMPLAEMARRYRDMLGQYDRCVLHDDEGAEQRLAEVSDALISGTRILIGRLLPGSVPVPGSDGWSRLALDEDPDYALAVIEGRRRGSKTFAAVCLADAIRHGYCPSGWESLRQEQETGSWHDS